MNIGHLTEEKGAQRRSENEGRRETGCLVPKLSNANSYLISGRDSVDLHNIAFFFFFKS